MHLHNLRFIDVIRILNHDFACDIRTGKGTHFVAMRKVNGIRHNGIIPRHQIIQTGTLSGILKKLDIDRGEFESKLDKKIKL